MLLDRVLLFRRRHGRLICLNQPCAKCSHRNFRLALKAAISEMKIQICVSMRLTCDFVNWSALQTNRITGPAIEIMDGSAASWLRRFYRVRRVDESASP